MPEQSTQPLRPHAHYALHRNPLRRYAWIAVVIAELDLIAWGLMAAALPQYMPGPANAAMLPVQYQTFSDASAVWLAGRTAAFITLEFRLLGVLSMTIGIMGLLVACTGFRRGERWAWWALLVGNTIAFAAPMTYHHLVSAIGPFELTEYVGITLVYIALVVSAPIREHDDAAPPRRWRRAPRR